MSYGTPDHQPTRRQPKGGGFFFVILLAFGALMLFRQMNGMQAAPDQGPNGTQDSGDRFDPIEGVSNSEQRPSRQNARSQPSQKQSDWGMESLPAQQAEPQPALNQGNAKKSTGKNGFGFEEVELKKDKKSSGFEFTTNPKPSSTKPAPPKSTKKGDFGFEEVPTKKDN